MENQPVTTDSELGDSNDEKVPSRDRNSELALRLRDMLGQESVTSFGRRCGIGEATLRKYFSGTLPNSENLVAIADAGNVSIEWLAAGRGPKTRRENFHSQSKNDAFAARMREVYGSNSVTSFSRKAGIEEDHVRSYLSGTFPSAGDIVLIADMADVNIEWLAAGRGPKVRGEDIIKDIDRLTLAIEAVDEGLGPRYVAMPPSKRAQLLAAVYDLLLDMDQKDNVIKFIKLAA